jgi:hypothetical protein
MFPTLRLILSASFATLVLVALVGSGMVLFMPPPARLADASGTVRPVTTIIDDSRTGIRLDDGGRRVAELQRLLSLPSGPAQAYAAEPPAVFPYALKAAQPEQIDTLIPASDQAMSSETAASEESDAGNGLAAAPTVVAALPAATEEPPLVAPEPDPEPVPVETVTTIDGDAVPLPKPKGVSAETAAAPAKPQTAGRPRVKAKKLRSIAQHRSRKPLPEATEFEQRQGQFFNFGYGNTWDNRGGWTTQVGTGQRSTHTRPAE